MLEDSFDSSAGESSQGTAPLCQSQREVSTSEGGTYLLENQLIGRGSFGYVYPAQEKSTGYPVVIKEVSSSQVASAAWREVDVLKLLQKGHAHIVRLFDVLELDGRLMLVMERLEQSLDVVRRRAGRIHVRNCRDYLKQILDGLHFLHSEAQVVHGDIKPANVMLTRSGTVKIVDFGLTLPVQPIPPGPGQGSPAPICWRGTPLFRPPEANYTGTITPPWDVWSFAIMAIILVSGKYPKPYRTSELGMTLMLKISEVTSEELLPSLEECPELSDALSNMLKRCLEREPRARPTCEGLLGDPFFGGNISNVARTVESEGTTRAFLTHLPRDGINLVETPIDSDETGAQEDDSFSAPLLYMPLAMVGVRVVKGTRNEEYRLNPELLGRGSTGVVYSAVEEVAGNQVAIKEIEWFHKALVYEEEALQKLQLGHPNVVLLHDLVYYADGLRVLLVMERLQSSLQQLLSYAGKVGVGELRMYLEQTLQGLDFLHTEAKLMHRNLKPSNLMLTKQGVLKIVDV
eukprot:RCo015685